jgi:hypothetical protein
MPTMVDAAAVANKNNELFMQGAKSVADSITKGKEREQNQQQFEARQAQDQQQFADQMQLRRDQMQQENLFKNRDYWETKRMNDLKEQQVLAELEQKKKQQEYMQKMYDKFFSDADEQELQQLLAKYQNSGNASAVMAGLNPQFMNMR